MFVFPRACPNLNLFEFESARIKLIIHALLGDELLVVAPLDDPAVIENHNRVGVAHRGKPVGDDKHRSALHQLIHAVLHEGFGTGIDGGSRLVEDHCGRIRNRRAGDGDELALPLREVGAVVGQHGVVPFGQTGDEVVRVGEFCRRDALFVRRVQPAVTDIVHDRARKQVGILQNDAERPTQILFIDLVDIDAVVADLAVLDVVETVDEVGDGRLARARGADEGDLLPRLGVQGNVG